MADGATTYRRIKGAGAVIIGELRNLIQEGERWTFPAGEVPDPDGWALVKSRETGAAPAAKPPPTTTLTMPAEAAELHKPDASPAAGAVTVAEEAASGTTD